MKTLIRLWNNDSTIKQYKIPAEWYDELKIQYPIFFLSADRLVPISTIWKSALVKKNPESNGVFTGLNGHINVPFNHISSILGTKWTEKHSDFYPHIWFNVLLIKMHYSALNLNDYPYTLTVPI